MALRAVTDAYRGVRGWLRPVWTGVYTHYEDVPVSGPGFDGGVWEAMTRAHTERALAALRSGAPQRATGDRALLPELAARLLADRREVRIVDFGGGMGIGYLDVRATVGPAVVDYVVVETPAVCASGRSLFTDDPAVRFVTSLGDAGAGADIVYVSSALQYVAEPMDALRELAGLEARYLLLVNLSAGDIPTYATAQRNVPGSVIAYWFLALSEVIDLLRSLGYVTRRASASERRLTGFAVPRRYRIGSGRNLLFERTAPRV
jgi:putative methyltransferase (TIGR04325 family)